MGSDNELHAGPNPFSVLFRAGIEWKGQSGSYTNAGFEPLPALNGLQDELISKLVGWERGIGMEYQEPDIYQQFRAKVQRWIDSQDARNSKWAEYLMYAPDLFHLLVRLSLDPDVPGSQKIKLLAVIGYFISPFDVLPEFVMGPLGLLDDIALAAWVLNSIVNESDPEIVRRYWAGNGDSLEVIQRILATADDMIGSGLWERLKKKFD